MKIIRPLPPRTLPVLESINPSIHQSIPEQPLIGSRLSARIIQATGKQPCAFCSKVRDTLDAAHALIRK